MTKTKLRYKFLAVIMAAVLMITVIPFAGGSAKVAAASNRDTVVNYHRAMATIKWTPQKNITYWSSTSKFFYAGTTYTGMPYTQYNRQNLTTFKNNLNSKNVYTGSATQSGYVGNDCSSSVLYAWRQVSSSISFGYTGNMFPGSGTGVLAVGSYKSNASTSTTKKITQDSGAGTMYNAYAQLQPGDAIVARVPNVVGHTRLISGVNVVRNADGSVNGSSSYVTCIEQGGLSSSRHNTTWSVDIKYTFSNLYSTYYIPITCSELANESTKPATGPSQLKIESYNVPTSLALGKSFSIYGNVTSNYTIKSVTVGIYNANGSAISERKTDCGSRYFSIGSVDKYVKFNLAKAGTNYYKVVATDEKTTKTLVNHAYTVGGSSDGAASTLNISDYNYPTTLVKGKSFSIKGNVSSNYNITSLTVGIYNANGGAVSTRTVKPNAKSYSIKSVDAYIIFGNASVGTNYYRVKASDQKVTKTLLDKAFTVTDPSAASTLNIKDYNYPTVLTQGQSYSIKGTVYSNYKITSLTVGIYDANMNTVSAKTVKPNAKKYSIKTVDAYIKFNYAGVGTNYYIIKATDEKITKTLVKVAYTVKSKDPASTLKIAGYNVPTTLKQGQSFSIKGAVTSNYAITKVTVGIYNANGTALSVKSATPNAKNYNISKIDAYVKFGVAPVGTNYYKISASDTKISKTLVNQAYKVTSAAAPSTLSISGHNVPGTLNQGQAFSIRGTVKSNYRITNVTVGIYNANGSAISTRSVNPNSTSFNVATVDAYIVFNKAQAGTNYYKITATDQQTTKTLVNQAYTVKSNQPASTLNISGHNVPGTLGAGKSFSIRGTVSSNYNITSLTVGIYSSNGSAVSTKTVYPNARSYAIANIDKYIVFGRAGAGTNYYRVVATDQKTTKTLLNHAYSVQSAAAPSTLSISGHNVPGTLGAGKSFSIRGTVSSNYNITSLTVGIYSSNGAAVSTKTVSPNAKSYSIANVDKYIVFGRAGAGTNYYRVVATDAMGTKTLLNHAYTVSGGGSSSSGAIRLSVPSYKQFDSRWKNVRLGSGSDTTIGAIGCTTTSIAMVESYRTGSTIYPDAMARKISYTSGGAVAAWPRPYYQSVPSSYYTEILNRLKAGKPTIFAAKKSNGGQHWVVITGYTGGSTTSASSYIINDPGSSYRTLLSEYLAAYPYYYKLLIY